MKLLRASWSWVAGRLRDSNWAVIANDGIIATAGILQGFSGAGASDRFLIIAASAATLAGSLSAGGAEWAETAAERDRQLRMAADERAELAADPGAARTQIAAYWEQRGLTPDTARDVADQLFEADPLAAGLDAEYGLEELMPASEPVLTGLRSAGAFAIGALVPLLITFVTPLAIELPVILVAVAVSLVFTSVVAARLGRVPARGMVLRSLAVAALTMGLSYALGLVLL